MKILIIGTGNVAAALGKAFLAAGHQLAGIAGRDETKTRKLASRLKTNPFFSFSKIPVSADLTVIAVKDDAISSVASQLPKIRGVVVHTSGSTNISALKRFAHRGVLWPVETISKTNRGKFKGVPFVIEGADERTTTLLMRAVHSLSGETYVMDSDQRKVMHMAAVIVNNFTNYLLTVAEDILQKESLPFEVLQKLSESTVQNAFRSGAKSSQTGPAARNDRKTIEQHFQYLSQNRDYERLYRMISEMISRVHKVPSKP